MQQINSDDILAKTISNQMSQAANTLVSATTSINLAIRTIYEDLLFNQKESANILY